jgi:hypothetical protein
MQDLDLYCRSYGDQRNYFHLRAMQAAQKTSSNIFLINKRKLCHADRSIRTRKALVHSILISEVIDMKSEVLRAVKGSLSRKKL